jgi:hypothetical protein
MIFPPWLAMIQQKRRRRSGLGGMLRGDVLNIGTPHNRD